MRIVLYWVTLWILFIAAAGGLLTLLHLVPWAGAAAIITVICGFASLAAEAYESLD